MRTIASLKADSEECAQIMDVTSSDKASHPCIKKPRDPIAKSTLGYRIMAAAAQDYLASNIVSSIDESSDCLPLLQEAVHCSDQEQQQQRGQQQVLAPRCGHHRWRPADKHQDQHLSPREQNVNIGAAFVSYIWKMSLLSKFMLNIFKIRRFFSQL